MESVPQIDSNTLRTWLETGKKVSILDIRPIQERTEWYIPGSIYFNAYENLKVNNPDALHGLYLDKTIPVVAVCAGGKTSTIAAGLLQNKGFEAYSLLGGMKGWSMSWNTAKISFPDFEVIQFRRTGKGCLSYIFTSGADAIAVDASLPVEVYEGYLKTKHLNLKHVLETHIHADHLSRSKQLAENNKATFYLPVLSKVNFDFEPVTNDSIIQFGKIRIKAIQTPGHTIESISYFVNEKVLLSGDTLFINGVGRPDLKANNDEARQRSEMLYQSLQKLLAMGDTIIVLPAHTSQPVDFDNTPIQSTIGDIKNALPILQLNEPDFITAIMNRIPPTPANYLSIVEKNIQGDFSDINPVDLEAGANRCAVS